MKKLISLTLLLLLMTPCLRAQRKELSQARSYLKSGKDLDKGENILTDLLSGDSLNRLNPKIYRLWYQTVRKQYDAVNEKLYLKENCDTAPLFTCVKRMFSIAESLDTLDAAPNAKGVVKPAYRQKHAAELNELRPNLYNGGVFFMNKGDYQSAYSLFDAYLDCGRQPLFGSYDYQNTDRLMTSAAYWTVYCGYKAGEPEKTLAYFELAMRDTSKHKLLLRYAAEAYKLSGNSQGYLRSLKRGLAAYPEYPYFFPRLIDYYMQKNMLDSALVIADRALAVNGSNELFLLAKSTVLLNSGKNDECIAVSDSLIHVNDTLADPYFNAGTACLNKILQIESAADNSRDNRTLVRSLYQQACPYMERYRELMPEDKENWAPALYRIYLNLNMGKQFEEIDRILNSK